MKLDFHAFQFFIKFQHGDFSRHNLSQLSLARYSFTS